MRILLYLAVLLALALGLSCSGSDFSGQALTQGTNSDDDDDDSGRGDDDDDDNSRGDDDDDNGLEIGEDETVHLPQTCDGSNVTFISENQDCPKYTAAYAVDDGKSARFSCCPLPARDVLSKDAPTTRNGNCAGDEVITGAGTGTSLKCTRINTKRYILQPPQTTCYNGSGASGGDGSSACGAPPATLSALVTNFGSDACLAFPFGGLVTGRTGKNCGDCKASQLKYKDTGETVVMYD